MSRFMSIDYGEARVGIGLTDPLKIIASGYCTLQNDENLLNNILNICREKEVEAIVMGIPYDQYSQLGESAKKVLNFTKELIHFFEKENFNVPFYEQDERYTTAIAYDTMKSLKVKKKRRKKVVDQIAAASILKKFMESNKKVKIDL